MDIQTVEIVDDDHDARQAYADLIVDANLGFHAEDGPLGNLEDFLAKPMHGKAALTDFFLTARNYATFTGAELVAGWYDRRVPALLCTRYEKAQIESIRPYRRWIPVLVTPSTLTPDTLLRGFNFCLMEMKGSFTPERRPWRTQVHFLEKDEESTNTYFVELPGWDVQEVLKVRLRDLPGALQSSIQPDFRCHAQANLGASNLEELYLCDWEET